MSAQDQQDFGFGAPREPRQWWPFWKTTSYRMALHEYYCVPFHREVRTALSASAAATTALGAKIEPLAKKVDDISATLVPLAATVEEVSIALAPLKAMTPELTTVQQVMQSAQEARRRIVRYFIWTTAAIGLISGLITAWPMIKWAAAVLLGAMLRHLST